MELPRFSEIRDGQIWCLICQVKTESQAVFDAHRRSKQHLRSFTMRQIAQKSSYGCVACAVELSSLNLFETHIRTNRHREQVTSKTQPPSLSNVKSDIVYHCGLCKFDLHSSEEFELHQYSALHRSKEQSLAQGSRRGVKASTPSGSDASGDGRGRQSKIKDEYKITSTPPSSTTPLTSSLKPPAPEVSRDLSVFVAGFDEAFLETTAEMKAFLEPFYVPSSSAPQQQRKRCRKCSAFLPPGAKVWRHVFEEHLRVRPFFCACGARFACGDDLRAHVRMARHEMDEEANAQEELRVLRAVFSKKGGEGDGGGEGEQSRREKQRRREKLASSSLSETRLSAERESKAQIANLSVTDSPTVEPGLRSFLMSKFPSSPKCLEKHSSSAVDLKSLLSPYFSKFIALNRRSMMLECGRCEQVAPNFWEHVYLMHLKVLPFKCSDCGHHELTLPRMERHCHSMQHRQERGFEARLLQAALESVWPSSQKSVNLASASPSSLTSNSSLSSGYSSGWSSADGDAVGVVSSSGAVKTSRRSPNHRPADTITSRISVSSTAPEPLARSASTTPPRAVPSTPPQQVATVSCPPGLSQPVEFNVPTVSDDLRMFVISQLAPRTISFNEMKRRLEQFYQGFITKFIPLSESQCGGDSSTPAADAKSMKFCTKCHRSFDAVHLWNHVYEFHLRCKPFACSDCPVARLSEEELTKHCGVKDHEPDPLSEFKMLRIVFFGREIKPAVKPDTTPEIPPEVISISDAESATSSPVKIIENPVDANFQSLSPTKDSKPKRPRISLFNPSKTNVNSPALDSAASHSSAADAASSKGAKKKARKTMASRPPSRTESNDTADVVTSVESTAPPIDESFTTPGKTRKRAAMGGVSVMPKKKKVELISADASDNEDFVEDGKTTTTNTDKAKKTARKMARGKAKEEEGVEEINLTNRSEDPTVSVELADFMSTQTFDADASVKELKRTVKNYYLSKFVQQEARGSEDSCHCMLCDSIFKRTLLLHHIYRYHLKVKPFYCMDCPKRVTWSANLELHCAENGHAPDADSETRFLRTFFARFGGAVGAAEDAACETAPPIRRVGKRKGGVKEKAFKLESVAERLRPKVEADLYDHIVAQKLPRSSGLNEFRFALDVFFFGACVRDASTLTFAVECARCGRKCTQDEYWAHVYEQHLRVRPFACSGCDFSSASYKEVNVHCFEIGTRAGTGVDTVDTGATILSSPTSHCLVSEELTFLSTLFNKTACAAFAESSAEDATGLKNPKAATLKLADQAKLRARQKIKHSMKQNHVIDSLTDREVASMMSPQAMRNYIYEKNLNKDKRLAPIFCDHGCDYKTKDVAVYQQHVRRHNSSEGRYHCDICSYNVNDKIQLSAHQKFHHKKREEALAGDRIEDVLALGADERGVFGCPHCDFSVRHKRGAFVTHLTRHSMTRDAGQFYCTLCCFSGDGVDDVADHIRDHHTGGGGRGGGEEVQEVTGISRSGTMRKISKRQIQKIKDTTPVTEELRPEDPDYKQKLLAKYLVTAAVASAAAPLSLTTLGLLTDDEAVAAGNKKKKTPPPTEVPTPMVALKKAPWREAFAEVTDAELQLKVTAILNQMADVAPDGPGARSVSRRKRNSSKNAALLSGSTSPKIATPIAAAPSKDGVVDESPKPFVCGFCPFDVATPEEMERHLLFHASIKSMLEELVRVGSDELCLSDKDAGSLGDVKALPESSLFITNIAKTKAVTDKTLTDTALPSTDEKVPSHEVVLSEASVSIHLHKKVDSNLSSDGDNRTHPPEAKPIAHACEETWAQSANHLSVPSPVLTNHSNLLPTSQLNLHRPLQSTLLPNSLRLLSPLQPITLPQPSPHRTLPNALDEVTFLRCQFCCHSSKSSVNASRHLRTHFDTGGSLTERRPTIVAVTARDVENLKRSRTDNLAEIMLGGVGQEKSTKREDYVETGAGEECAGEDNVKEVSVGEGNGENNDIIIKYRSALSADSNGEDSPRKGPPREEMDHFRNKILENVEDVNGEDRTDPISTSISQISNISTMLEMETDLDGKATSETLPLSSESPKTKTTLSPKESTPLTPPIVRPKSLDDLRLILDTPAPSDFDSPAPERAVKELVVDEAMRESARRILDEIDSLKARTASSASDEASPKTTNTADVVSPSPRPSSPFTVSCPRCEISLESRDIFRHALQHSVCLDEELDAVEADLFLGKRLEERLGAMRRRGKKEEGELMAALEEDEEEEKTTELIACRFCCLEVSRCQVEAHEARHTGEIVC